MYVALVVSSRPVLSLSLFTYSLHHSLSHTLVSITLSHSFSNGVQDIKKVESHSEYLILVEGTQSINLINFDLHFALTKVQVQLSSEKGV
ncbi:hypothetical protein ACB092_11G137300 [Castanea dentata]